jgi:hypothetical protein
MVDVDLAAAFAGTLFMPDKEFLNSRSPVLLADGQAMAYIQWSTWTQRFSVLDAAGGTVAECRPQGVLRKRFIVRAVPSGRVLVDLKPGAFRPFNGAELTVSGHPLRVRQASMWSDRRFEFYAGERLVGRIQPTTGVFTLRPDSYAFELPAPMLSGLEAVSLAQVVRTVARGLRQASAASSGGGAG